MTVLAYTTNRLLKVDYWQAGLAYYLFSGTLAAIYAGVLFQQGSFFYSVPIQGEVNPYVVPETHPYESCGPGQCSTVAINLNSARYCASDDYQYFYSDTFKYFSGAESGSAGPACELVDPMEISSKTFNRFTISTVLLKTVTYVWPDSDSDGDCDDETDALAVAAIAACGAKTVPREISAASSTECTCEYMESIFPSAVEDYGLHMPHKYEVQGHGTIVGTWDGSSSDPADDLESTFGDTGGTMYGFSNGTTLYYEAGQEIKMTIKELLELAGNTALDDFHEAVSDSDDRFSPERKPTYRHTGLKIEVSMEYTNKPGDQLRGDDVDVYIKPEAKTGQWQSVGPSTTYPTYPTGSLGSRKFHRIVTYPQDIIVSFKTQGRAFDLEAMKIIETILQIVVIFTVTKTIMDFIIFNLLPNGVSHVLKNKRDSRTTRKMAFQELGMHAAVSISQFRALDKEGSGRLNFAELVREFGTIDSVDEKHAIMIAKTIMGQRANDLSQGTTFEEFMSIMHGEAITFEAFLKLVEHTGGNLSALSLQAREEAAKKFNEAAKGIVLPPAAPQSVASGATPMTAVTAAPVQPPPQMPPGVVKIVCYNCKQPFGAPQNAPAVGCPHCRTVNKLQAV